MERKGFWLFDIENSYDKNFFEVTVLEVLKILEKHKILITESVDIDSWVIKGKTFIEEKGILGDIITFDFEFRNPGFGLSICNYSDIWLPMVFDEDSYAFNWNLEQYNLNYERLPSVLKEIQTVLEWDDDSSKEIDFTERGCIQIGYDLFLCEEVISREYADNPNPEFDLEAYLKKMKDAEARVRSGC